MQQYSRLVRLPVLGRAALTAHNYSILSYIVPFPTEIVVCRFDIERIPCRVDCGLVAVLL